MILWLFAFYVTLFSVCTATDFAAWHPPTGDTVRGPCPALNSLANHNLLPHNGKNISAEMMVKAMNEALNISPETGGIVAGVAIQLLGGASGRINLDQLNKHGVIEHDGSLSREDFDLGGDNHSFRQDIFNSVLAFFKGSDYVTLPAAAAARYHRIQSSRRRNPKFTYRSNDIHASYLETALYFLTMVDPETGLTPVKFVRTLFEQERLPYVEGWRRPNTTITGLLIGNTILDLGLASPEKINFLNQEKASARYKSEDIQHPIGV